MSFSVAQPAQPSYNRPTFFSADGNYSQPMNLSRSISLAIPTVGKVTSSVAARPLFLFGPDGNYVPSKPQFLFSADGNFTVPMPLCRSVSLAPSAGATAPTVPTRTAANASSAAEGPVFDEFGGVRGIPQSMRLSRSESLGPSAGAAAPTVSSAASRTSSSAETARAAYARLADASAAAIRPAGAAASVTRGVNAAPRIRVSIPAQGVSIDPAARAVDQLANSLANF